MTKYLNLCCCSVARVRPSYGRNTTVDHSVAKICFFGSHVILQNSQAFFDDLSLFKIFNMFFGIVSMFVLIYSGLSERLSLNFGILKGRF